MSFKETLKRLESEGNLRTLPKSLSSGMVDFTSNDYLGIASNLELTDEFLEGATEKYFSSSASRLLASRQDSYLELEELLSNEFNRDCLLFNSGYHINTGILPSLVLDDKCLILADKLVHASLIDGIKLSRAEFKRFPHNDLNKLRKLIERNYDLYDRIIIATESVFSMDGDSPDLEVLLQFKHEFPKIILYLDEAHAFGVKGPKGLGISQSTSKPELWDIIVYPLGKSAASMGAFVICNEEIKNILINRSRSLIYSTALPPIQIKWTTFVIKRILGMDKEREHLQGLSKDLNRILMKYQPDTRSLSSHIQPLIIGDPLQTIRLSHELSCHGVKALPIRRPTVPLGTERLRFSLTASMQFKDLDILDHALNS